MQPTLKKLLRSDVLVPTGAMSAFNDVLKHLNSKALRFGLDPIRVLGEVDVPHVYRSEVLDDERVLFRLVPANGVTEPWRTLVLKRITVEYPILKLGDWLVIGLIEQTDSGTLRFAVSDQPADHEALEQYVVPQHGASLPCEHCRTSRPRRQAYFLREATSRRTQLVGSTCLKDFTGVDPAALLFLAEMESVGKFCDAECDRMTTMGKSFDLPLLTYLAAVCFCVSNGPFVSASAARDTHARATFDAAFSELSRPSRKFLDALSAWEEEAAAVLQWCESLRGASSYEQNLKVLLSQSTLRKHPRHLALAASAVQAMRRAVQAPSKHVGDVGQELCTTVTLQRIYQQPSRFSARAQEFTLDFSDAMGNQLRWRTTSTPEPRICQVGAHLNIRCRVSKHEEFGGVARTMVSRLKALAG